VPTTIPPPVGRAPTPPQDQDWPIASRTTSTRRTALAGRELELIVARKAHLIGAHADHFTLLGVPPDAAPDTVSSALALLERQLAPDRLGELRLESLATEAVRVLEHLRAAAAVLIDPAKRAAYRANPSGAPADPAAEAKAAYRRAELLMRSDRLDKAVVELDRACELAPDDITYRAARAWAKFCAASDKAAVADETRKLLNHAAMHSENPEIPRFWLGRVERILGREREALRHFQAVLELQPGHKDATSEVRILEARFRR
jgi:tetratricopeptide (TPR) repeat protein